MKTCPKCKTTKEDSEFYKRKRGGRGAYCKICTNKQTLDRQRLFKRQCVEYKGGKCNDCKVVDHPCVYDFHHENPKLKDFAISKMKRTAFSQEIADELDKCTILCSNCHRKRHGSY